MKPPHGAVVACGSTPVHFSLRGHAHRAAPLFVMVAARMRVGQNSPHALRSAGRNRRGRWWHVARPHYAGGLKRSAHRQPVAGSGRENQRPRRSRAIIRNVARRAIDMQVLAVSAGPIGANTRQWQKNPTTTSKSAERSSIGRRRRKTSARSVSSGARTDCPTSQTRRPSPESRQSRPTVPSANSQRVRRARVRMRSSPDAKACLSRAL